MTNNIYTTIGASNHTDKEREKNDYYATDPIAIEKLLTVETPYHNIWECACGECHLTKRLIDYGYDVFSSDLIDRGKQNQIIDFLTVDKHNNFFFKKFDIITNPPYKQAKEFVLKALDIIPEGNKVYMFLKLTFLEGKARFREIFSKHPPKTIYVFSERVLCAKNAEFQKMKDGGGSAVAYAWFVWEKGYNGKTFIDWI